MRKKTKGTSKVPKRLREWAERAKSKGSSAFKKGTSGNKLGKSIGDKIPKRLKEFHFDQVNLKNVSEYTGWFRWGLLVLFVFVLAQLIAGFIGLYISPSFPPVPSGRSNRGASVNQGNPGNFSSIEDRNIFNVEGTIPEPFETGLLDCLSQARASSQPIELLGTIVMSAPEHSTALVSLRSNPEKIAVKKDDWFFDGRYLALEIARKKICFQVRATQELEFIEIPEEGGAIGISNPSMGAARSSGGINAVSDSQFEVSKSFLETKLLNLNKILQTARAVPYIEPGTNQFQGFLVQSIDPDSPFAELGIRQGDVLKQVNDITLDNAGKGLEAFQQLRNSGDIKLKIVRSGREQTLEYSLK